MKKIALHPLAESTLVETGGTLLSGLLRNDMHVLMSCGGKGLCSTCHVWVKRGMDQLSPVGPREKRTLSLVAEVRPESRLACQCTVYHLLTGRLPFSGKSAQEVLLKHLRVPAPPPHEIAPGVPPSVSQVVLTMMEKAADDRYPDYAAVRADLMQAMED